MSEYTQEDNLHAASLLIEAEVKLLSDSPILFSNFYAQTPYITICSIVEPAIVENELHVIHEVLDPRVLVFLKLRLDSLEVHRVLHDRWVVWDPELLIIDWVREDVGFLVALQRC